jgi:hypothetical protein
MTRLGMLNCCLCRERQEPVTGELPATVEMLVLIILNMYFGHSSLQLVRSRSLPRYATVKDAN